MRLAYFPRPLEDELLYSVVARYGRHVGARSAGGLSDDLFGGRTAAAAFDLPCRIASLVERLPAGTSLTVDGVIDGLTLFPYYASHRSAADRRSLRDGMAGRDPTIYVRTGLAASRVPRVSRLRFCPECDRGMLATQGERWWRRAHQLPGVFLCPDHGTVLRLSSVDLAVSARHAYVPASETACPSGAERLCSMPLGTTALRLLEFARASADLLSASPTPWRPLAAVAAVRAALAERGLMRSARKVDQRRLMRTVADFWGEALSMVPGGVGEDGTCGPWLVDIVRHHRKAFHPVHHLLLAAPLAAAPVIEGPFGSGPWACRNPLAGHSGRLVVKDLSCLADNGSVTGTFRCRCGYAYTRRQHPDGLIGPPRLKTFGPMLEPALRRMLVPGATRRGVATSLGIDAKTLLREIAALGLDAPWPLPTPSSSAAVVRPRPVGKMTPSRPSKPRFDWAAIDAAKVAAVRIAVADIVASGDTVRATFSEIERRLGGRGCLGRRGRRLPEANRVARALVEDVEAFRRRRVARVLDRMLSDDPLVPAWKVMREAGLKSGYLALIEDRLSARRSSRAA